MALSSNHPIVFIACIVGLAFLASMIWLGFYIARHRLRPSNPDDPEQQDQLQEQQQSYMDGVVLRRHALSGNHQQQQRQMRSQHPPVYCVDDLASPPPPPSYQAVFSRSAPASAREMHVLRARLDKLQRGGGRGPAGSGGETAIRESEMRSLARWIDDLERLRAQEAHRRRFGDGVRMASSASEPAVRLEGEGEEAGVVPGWRQRSATDPGLIGLARSTEDDVAVATTPMMEVGERPAPGEVDVRITALGEQLMRSAPDRCSGEER